MKVINKLQFGVQAIQSGRKASAVSDVPTLVASCTNGKFNINGAVSKFLNISVGENVMFLNNIANIEAAIQRRDEAIVSCAAELGYDIDTREGQDALVKEFTQWFIAKGVAKYNPKTKEPIYATERMSAAEKQAYLDANIAEIVEKNREALVEEFGEMPDEELAKNVTVDMIELPKYHVCEGSKTATTGNTTGVGCNLTFTDSSIWRALKQDLGNDMRNKNRVFIVKTADAVQTDFFDGKENKNITIVPIEFSEDTDVSRNSSKEEDSKEEGSEE